MVNHHFIYNMVHTYSYYIYRALMKEGWRTQHTRISFFFFLFLHRIFVLLADFFPLKNVMLLEHITYSMQKWAANVILSCTFFFFVVVAENVHPKKKNMYLCARAIHNHIVHRAFTFAHVRPESIDQWKIHSRKNVYVRSLMGNRKIFHRILSNSYGLRITLWFWTCASRRVFVCVDMCRCRGIEKCCL